jgi:hypothetical protein
MVGALLLGFVCGVIARVRMPGDMFRLPPPAGPIQGQGTPPIG